MFFETLKLALRAISRNMLRSFLTVLASSSVLPPSSLW